MIEYDNFAKYHDLYHSGRERDIIFWTKIANNAKGSILEIGCGTGRLLIPIAENGHDVVGVDLSRKMLDAFKCKIKLHCKAKDRIKLVLANMKDHNLRQKFDFIFIPWGFYYPNFKLQKQVLLNLRNHLKTNGKICLDVYNYLRDAFPRRFRIVSEEPVYSQLGLREIAIFRFQTRQNDPFTHTDWVENHYHIFNPKTAGLLKLIKNRRVEFRFSAPYLRNLLQACSLKIVRTYGDYDFSRLKKYSPRLIFLCKKDYG